MAKKVLRNRSQITSTIDPEMHETLRSISEQTDIPISKLLDKSVELLKSDFVNKGLYVIRGSQSTSQKQSNLRVADDKQPYKTDNTLPNNDQ